MVFPTVAALLPRRVLAVMGVVVSSTMATFDLFPAVWGNVPICLAFEALCNLKGGVVVLCYVVYRVQDEAVSDDFVC